MSRGDLDRTAEFERAAREYGLDIAHVVADGRIHRVPDAQHHRRRNDVGWYRFDGRFGTFGSWFRNDKVQWTSKGGPPPTDAERRRWKADRDRQRKDAEAARRKDIAEARELWDRATPCATHPYLRAKQVEAYGLRADGDTLLVPVWSPTGDLQSVQRIYRNDVGGFSKRFKGPAKLGTFVIAEADAATIVVVEGYATGASVHAATGLPVVVTFSADGMESTAGLLRERFPQADFIVAGDCGDKLKTGQKAAHAAAKVLGARVAIPKTPGDWNDVAASEGLQAVAAGIFAAEHLPGAIPNKPEVPLAEATAKLEQTVATFFEGNHQPGYVGVVNVTPGSGKSHAWQKPAAARVREGETVFVFVPNHRLSAEMAASFERETGLPAAVFRGMGQDDPDIPGKQMCWIPDVTEDAGKVGIKAEEVCAACPHCDECGYHRQRTQDARVWFLAHAIRYMRGVPKGLPKPDWIVLEEDSHEAALTEDSRLAASTLDASIADVIGSDRDVLSAVLAAVRAALRKAAETPDGHVAKSHIEGPSANDLRAAAAIAWKRRPKIVLPHGDVAGIHARIRKEFAGEAAFNSKVARLLELLAQLLESGNELSPHIRVVPETLANGEGSGNMVYLSSRKTTEAEAWKAPTLILDGTARMEIVERFFPGAELLADINVAAPHQTVTRVRHTFSKAWMVPSEKAGERRNAGRLRNVERLRRWIEVTAWRHAPGPMLVVCNKEVEERLRAGKLPGNVATGHFNATRGRNRWETVDGRVVDGTDLRAVVVVGRTLPDRKKTRRKASVIAGEVLPDDHRLVDAVEWATCEAELLQNIARGRGVRRGADSPLDVYVLGDRDLPLRIDREISWGEAQPSPWELMAARGVYLPPDVVGAKGLSPVVAAVLPDVFSSSEAAKIWLKPSRGQTSIEGIPIDNGPREKLTPAKVRAGRYAVPVMVDLEAAERIEGLEVIPVQTAPASTSEPERDDCPSVELLGLVRDFQLAAIRAAMAAIPPRPPPEIRAGP